MTDEESNAPADRKPANQETPADEAEKEQGKQLDEGTETPG